MNIVISEINWMQGIEFLERKGFAVLYDPDLWKNRDRLKEEVKKADALIVRNQTKVDQELLHEASRLKVIGRLGVGLDNIDLTITTQRKIPVVYGKNANAVSVAEYVISSFFTCTRLISEASVDVKEGHWNRKRFTGSEVYGKVLGLIGVGEISHRVAVRASALGMKVIGYDPYVTSYDFPVVETGVQLMELEEVIKQSDFLSLHVPLTSTTRNLINANRLQLMKQNAFIINSSRGGIINEHDLSAVLRSKTIAGAILDVLEQEPPNMEHPLLQLDNCVITPHIAGLTEESQIRVSEMVAKEVSLELEGKVSLCRVN